METPVNPEPVAADDDPAGEAAVIRVLLVDDQGLVRAGVRTVLEAESDMEVVGEARNGLEAIDSAKRLKPDVILMDVRMPELDGLEAARRLLADPPVENLKVLMLTTFDLDDYVYEALGAGASGFLLKDAPVEQLPEAVRVVHEGQALLAPTTTRRLIADLARGRHAASPPQVDELTAREREVFLLLARGLSNAEIAERLVVGATTVKTHVAAILLKLGLRDRIQAVVMAYEWGLVSPGDEAPDKR